MTPSAQTQKDRKRNGREEEGREDEDSQKPREHHHGMEGRGRSYACQMPPRGQTTQQANPWEVLLTWLTKGQFFMCMCMRNENASCMNRIVYKFPVKEFPYTRKFALQN